MNDIVRSPDVIAGEINAIKRQTAITCLNAAVEIGKLLVEAKAGLEHGDFGKWLEENVDYSVSKANNLMKLYREYGPDKQLSAFVDNTEDIFGALSPSKALALTALPEPERVEYVQTHDVESESVRELQNNIEQLKRDLAQCENGYKQQLDTVNRELKDSKKALKDNNYELNRVRNELVAASARAKTGDDTIKVLREQLNELENAAPVVNDEKLIREYEERCERLQLQLKAAQNTDVQLFAVHFELFQKEYNILKQLLDKQEDIETAEKYRSAILKALAAFENNL